jgi:formate hydrogenlyase subunit 3/multisubunit Na+/H+ antiporter MnhD subunit
MSFAVVIEGMTIAAFAILLAGGKQRREAGWGALTVLALISAVVQAISMALMVSYGGERIFPALTPLDIPLRDRRSIFPWMVS